MSHEHPAPTDATSPEQNLRREAWLQELSEASLLPPEDAMRLRIEAEVIERGPWAESYWAALLAEGDSWRRALPAIEPSPELAGRLRSIPAQYPLLRMRRRRLLWGAAAAALVVVGLAWGLAGRGTGEAPSLQTGVMPEVAQVALLALNDHLDTHEQDVLSDDPATLARDLQPQIPFPVLLPDLGAGIEPVGGRRCTLGSHPVAFTAWRGTAGGRLTVIQLRRDDFGLPADMKPQQVHPEGQAAEGSPLDVLFFGRGDTVWVVVADDAQDLQRLRAHVLDGYAVCDPAQGIKKSDPEADADDSAGTGSGNGNG